MFTYSFKKRFVLLILANTIPPGASCTFGEAVRVSMLIALKKGFVERLHPYLQIEGPKP